MTGFEPVPCCWCGETVLATGERRVSHRFGAFHVDCPCPEQSVDGECPDCGGCMRVDPVLAQGLTIYTMPKHWVETPAQEALRQVEADLWDKGHRFGGTAQHGSGLPGWVVWNNASFTCLILARGWGSLGWDSSGPCTVYNVLMQKDLCPGSWGPAKNIRRPAHEGFGKVYPRSSYLTNDERRYK